MSKKRGLSADDKRAVIIKIYHEYKEPFNLKEIEIKASKAGVVLQTIKDMNQSLVDDSLLLTDKIGSANFFWSFPSKVMVDKLNGKEKLERNILRLKESIKSNQEVLDSGKEARRGDGRENKLSELEDLINEEKNLDKLLEASRENDPVEIEKISIESHKCKLAADRWTDNIFSLKKYLTKNKGIPGKQADKYLGIDSDFDYPVFSVKKK